MEERLLRLEEKLDRIVDTQAQIQANLQEHMRRTEIAEDNIEKLATNMAPVQEHVAFIRGASKLAGVILTILSIVVGYLKLRK